MPIRNERLLQLRDEAFDASRVAHDEMRAALLMFTNQAYQPGVTRVGRVYALSEKSFDSEIQKGILKLIPAFEEQAPRLSVQADRSARSEVEVMLTEDLEQWKDMYDEADGEGDTRHALIAQFLIFGNAVSKELWNVEQERCESIVVDPTCFAPDPAATQVDFSDAQYVCHRVFHTTRELQRRYPEWKPPKEERPQRQKRAKSREMPIWTVDEIWMRRDIAEWAGIDVSTTKREIIRVVLIEGVVYKAWGSPYWSATFPFQMARCFTKLTVDGRPMQFWGFGYAQMMWEQQKVYDEFYANAILVMRNQAVGRFLSKEGTLDMSQIPAIHGLNIEIEGELSDIMQLESDNVPPALFQWVQMLSQKMTEFIPSGNPVFTGEAPFGGASGRAISHLQFAAFGLVSSQVRAQSAYFVRRARERINRIQQFAHRPVKAELVRTALDIRDPFPEEARHIGFSVVAPDTASLPNTPQGKLEVISALAAVGVQLKPERLLEILGLDKSYGIRPDDLVQMLPPELAGMMGGGMLPPNQDVASGVEVLSPAGQQASP